jgi:threonine/homoserine/homoserine lactone efflux protein
MGCLIVNLAFLITSLVIVVTPGTGALLTISAGLSRGARTSVITAFGCTLGVLPHLAAAVTGTAALLRASGVAFETVKFLGVAYLLNPKLTIFFFAFLPQFVPPGSSHQVPRMLVLSAVFMAMTFAVFALYGVFAASVRHHLIDRPRIVRRLRQMFAVSFVGLSAKLATTAR